MNTNIEQSIDVYSLVTNRIIELLEAGTIPWQKPWTSSGIPRNLLSKRPYRGINILLLNSLNYTNNLFLTWKQIKTIGGSVLKGEKGHIVIFTKMIETDEMTKNNKRKLKPLLRYYKVFNIEQCVDIPIELIPTLKAPLLPLYICEDVIANMQNKPVIKFDGDNAFYHPALDYINMPNIHKFNTIEEYHGVLFHELIHSTGHPNRLNRKEINEPIVFGSESYSIEELTAEMGSCFLKSHCGLNIDNLANNAAYIQNWLELLRDDKRFIIQASTRAQKAVEYILNENIEELMDKSIETLIEENEMELIEK